MELIFGPEGHGVKELGKKSPGLPTRVGGAPPYLVDSPETPLTCSRRQNLLYIPKLLERNLVREFRRRKPL